MARIASRSEVEVEVEVEVEGDERRFLVTEEAEAEEQRRRRRGRGREVAVRREWIRWRKVIGSEGEIEVHIFTASIQIHWRLRSVLFCSVLLRFGFGFGFILLSCLLN